MWQGVRFLNHAGGASSLLDLLEKSTYSNLIFSVVVELVFSIQLKGSRNFDVSTISMIGATYKPNT